jgi:2-isopropylmalate synthase
MAKLKQRGKGDAATVGKLAQNVELYDTTLRDGAQAAGARFDRTGRLKVYEALDQLGIHYVELGWPNSQDMRDSFADCKKVQGRAKIAAFGSTSRGRIPKEDPGLGLMVGVRPDAACIVGKSWDLHVAAQLQISKQDNLDRISGSVDFLKHNGLMVVYDAEHYFDGFRKNPEYALSTLKAAANAGADRLVLCDTNGGTLTPEVLSTVTETKKWLRSEGIDAQLGTHFHDDSGVAVANAYATVGLAGMVQGTIAGIGERVGNLNLATFTAGLVYKTGVDMPGLDLKRLKGVVELVFLQSGLKMPKNLPYVGVGAFKHTGGIHIDGQNKSATYEHVHPGDFGNERVLSLNSQGGRASVLLAAERFGYKFQKDDPEFVRRSNALLLELGVMERRGYRMEDMEAEQFLLVEKHLGELKQFSAVSEPTFNTRKTAEGKEISTFAATFTVDGKSIEDRIVVEGGPVDAAYKLYKSVLSRSYEQADNLHLVNFTVETANKREEASAVRTEVTLRNGTGEFSTVGVDSNILISALEAISKGFNYHMNKTLKEYSGDLRRENGSE